MKKVWKYIWKYMSWGGFVIAMIGGIMFIFDFFFLNLAIEHSKVLQDMILVLCGAVVFIMGDFRLHIEEAN